MTMRKRGFILLALPIIIILWAFGWTLYYFGDKLDKRSRNTHKIKTVKQLVETIMR